MQVPIFSDSAHRLPFRHASNNTSRHPECVSTDDGEVRSYARARARARIHPRFKFNILRVAAASAAAALLRTMVARWLVGSRAGGGNHEGEGRDLQGGVDECRGECLITIETVLFLSNTTMRN